MMRYVRMLALLALAVTTAAFADGAVVTPLTPAQIPALLEAPAHGERIVMLWSLHCVYCEPNMRELARLQRAHPSQIQLITVATDSAEARHQIAARLNAAGMQAYTARAYAEPTPERMNFLIDPNWGGEMPRTIVLRADGSRLAISGLLTPAQLARIGPQ